MKVGIVIVNYNKKELIYNCLVSLEKITYENKEIIVVDNGSKDGSLEMIKSKFPYVKIIKMGFNSGFCRANNFGIKKSLKLNCKAVLLLNNDTEVEPDFLEKMVALLNATKKNGMVASKILFLKKRDIIDSAGLEITPDGLAKNRGLNQNSGNFIKNDEVFCPAGAAALYSRELLEDIKYNNQFLDESYEFYFEELDLGWRARLRGWKCQFASDAVVYHLKSATSGAYSEFIAYYTNRNIFFNIIKNYPTIIFYKALLLSFFRYFFLATGIIFHRGAASKIKKNIGLCTILKTTLLGWYSVFLHIKEIFLKRNYIQKTKIVSNYEIKKWFEDFGLTFFESLYK